MKVEPIENVQLGNVGNPGDVEKHLALVALLDALRERHTGPVASFESHAFQMTAPPSSRGLRTADDLAAALGARTGRGVERYRALQTQALARGEYLCSTALAAALLDGADVTYHWCEADPPTRRLLAAEASRRGLAPVLHDDAAALAPPAPRPGLAVAGLVDPFEWDGSASGERQLWRAVERFASAGTGSPGFLLMFNFVREGPSRWPTLAAPGWFSAPVATLDHGSHRLAVWTTASWRYSARDLLSPLGWQRSDPGASTP
jgi:hypothetical protein